MSISTVLPHKNADNLEIVPLKGRQFITAKGQFQPGDKGILITKGAVVPPREAFNWLWSDMPTEPFSIWYPIKKRTIRPRRLRGEWSSGLLMAPSELGLDISEIVEGTDLSDLVGVHDEDYFKGDCVSGRCAPKSRCQRNHMPRSLKGWIRYIRYRVIG